MRTNDKLYNARVKQMDSDQVLDDVVRDGAGRPANTPKGPCRGQATAEQCRRTVMS